MLELRPLTAAKHPISDVNMHVGRRFNSEIEAIVNYGAQRLVNTRPNLVGAVIKHPCVLPTGAKWGGPGGTSVGWLSRWQIACPVLGIGEDKRFFILKVVHNMTCWQPGRCLSGHRLYIHGAGTRKRRCWTFSRLCDSMMWVFSASGSGLV
jgi:hypothetical protein